MAVSTKFKPGDQVYFMYMYSPDRGKSPILTVASKEQVQRTDKAIRSSRPLVWMVGLCGEVFSMEEDRIFLHKSKKEMPAWM
jgi:hypothetical protein